MWWRSVMLLMAVAVGSVHAQVNKLPDVGDQIFKSRDLRNIEPTACPGVGNAGGPTCYDRVKRELTCCATPTPGSGSGGTCTRVTCTRSSAAVYSCSGLSSYQWVRVDNTVNEIVASSPSLNQCTVSGTTVTFGYSLDAMATRPTVEACGS